MIEELFGTIEGNRVKMLNLLKTNKIIMSMEDNCRLLTAAESVHSLETNQEEDDTKVFLHTYKILKETNNDYVVAFRRQIFLFSAYLYFQKMKKSSLIMELGRAEC